MAAQELPVHKSRERLDNYSFSRERLEDVSPGSLPDVTSEASQTGTKLARSSVKGTLPRKKSVHAGVYPNVVPLSVESVGERAAASDLYKDFGELHRTTDSANTDSAHLNSSNLGFSLTLHGSRTQFQDSIRSQPDGFSNQHQRLSATVSSAGVNDTVHTQFESARSGDPPAVHELLQDTPLEPPKSVQLPTSLDDTDTGAWGLPELHPHAAEALQLSLSTGEVLMPASIGSEVTTPDQQVAQSAEATPVSIKAEMQRELTHATVQSHGNNSKAQLQPSSDGGSSSGGVALLQMQLRRGEGVVPQAVSDDGSSSECCRMNHALELAQRVTVKPRSKHSPADIVERADIVDLVQSDRDHSIHRSSEAQIQASAAAAAQPVNLHRQGHEPLHCNDRGKVSCKSSFKATTAGAVVTPPPGLTGMSSVRAQQRQQRTRRGPFSDASSNTAEPQYAPNSSPKPKAKARSFQVQKEGSQMMWSQGTPVVSHSLQSNGPESGPGAVSISPRSSPKDHMRGGSVAGLIASESGSGAISISPRRLARYDIRGGSGAVLLASPRCTADYGAQNVSTTTHISAAVPDTEQASLRARSSPGAADTGSPSTQHTDAADAEVVEKDSRSSGTVELQEEAFEGSKHRLCRPNSTSTAQKQVEEHLGTETTTSAPPPTRCASRESAPDALEAHSKAGVVMGDVKRSVAVHAAQKTMESSSMSTAKDGARREAPQTLDDQGSGKGSNSVQSPQREDSGSQNSAAFMTTYTIGQEESSYLPSEQTRQLHDQYASAMDSPHSQSLGYNQMKHLLKPQRSESESFMGPITGTPVSVGPSTLATDHSVNIREESAPLQDQWSSLAGGPVSHTTDISNTPPLKGTGSRTQQQLAKPKQPLHMSPTLEALMRAVNDGKIRADGGVLPVHCILRRVRTNKDAESAAFRTQAAALVSAEDVFSPAASETQNPPETPNWAAPELVLKTPSDGNAAEDVNTPMTPTHELFKSNPFSTQSEYSVSDFSGLFSTATEASGMFRSGAAPSVGTPASSTPPPAASLHTPRLAPEVATGGLAVLRRPLLKVGGRQEKKKRTLGRRLTRKSGASMRGGTPLQGIQEETEPPKCYTTHGNPFFQLASGFSPSGGASLNTPLAPPVRRMSFEPSSFSAGRTLASAVAGAAALGAFERTSDRSFSVLGGAGGGGGGGGAGGSSTPHLDPSGHTSSINMNTNGNSKGNSKSYLSGCSSPSNVQHIPSDSTPSDIPHGRRKGNTSFLEASSSAFPYAKSKTVLNGRKRHSGKTADSSIARLLICVPCIGPQNSADSPRMHRAHAHMDMHCSDRSKLIDKFAYQTQLPPNPTSKSATKKLGGPTVHVRDALRADDDDGDDQAPLLRTQPNTEPDAVKIAFMPPNLSGKEGFVRKFKTFWAATRTRFSRV